MSEWCGPRLFVSEQCFRQYAALAAALPVDGGDDAGNPLEIEDRFLELLKDSKHAHPTGQTNPVDQPVGALP